MAKKPTPVRPLVVNDLGFASAETDPEQQAVQDYFGRLRQNPMTPEQEMSAAEKEKQILQEAGAAASSGGPAMAPQPGVSSGLGGGVVAIRTPQQEEAMYEWPEEIHTKSFESSSKKRLKALSLIAQGLSDPFYYNKPEHVAKRDEAALKSWVDQNFPIAKSFEETRPEAVKFGEMVQSLYGKRMNYITALQKEIALIDDTFKQHGQDSKKSAEILVPKLMGMLKIYNSALSNSADALATVEVNRLAPELNPEIFNLKNFNSVGGSVIGSNVSQFKDKLAELHDILISENRSGYNALAALSSPRFAKRFIPLLEEQSPYGQRVTSIVKDKLPKKVAEGELGRAQFIKQREMLFNDLKPKAEEAKNGILKSSIPAEEKRKLLKQLNDDFFNRTNRNFVNPDEAISQ